MADITQVYFGNTPPSVGGNPGWPFADIPGFKELALVMAGKELTDLSALESTFFDCDACDVMTDSGAVTGAEVIQVLGGRLHLTASGAQAISLTGGGIVAHLRNADTADFPFSILVKRDNAGTVTFTPVGSKLTLASGQANAISLTAGQVVEVEITFEGGSGTDKLFALRVLDHLSSDTVLGLVDDERINNDLGFAAHAYLAAHREDS